MNNTTFKAPECQLKHFNNLFIELTAKNCNQRCKNCYIDFPLNKNVKDFIPVELVKNALLDTKSEKIKCIYLTGAEPMTHPDFNTILRMCLKCSDVCIFTNGTFINEKKARFLKRVEEESENEIIFKISIDHYDEMKNDEIRSRGSYRAAINAIKSLVKYEFNPIICITNYYNEPEEELIRNFENIFKKIEYYPEKSYFVINNYFDKNNLPQISNPTNPELDCEYGRILTSKGIYTCPFLANDHRGRCGSNFKDFARHNTLETNYCSICKTNKSQFFGINYSLFMNSSVHII